VHRPDGPAPTRFGVEELLEPLETVIAACLAQDLLPRKLSAEEVLAPAQKLVGS
jgi:4,5-dihydroxyphthalate decarboxylase